jgi:hypothetical protein
MFLWTDCDVPMVYVHMEIGYALLIAFFYIYFVVIQYDPVLST